MEDDDSLSKGEGPSNPKGKKVEFEFVPYSPSGKRKHRVQRPFTSCTSCRRRKIKCLNETTPCKPCLEYGEICSLLGSDVASYQPPPPDVLKDQGIKLKKRRRTSLLRGKKCKKTDDGGGTEGLEGEVAKAAKGRKKGKGKLGEGEGESSTSTKENPTIRPTTEKRASTSEARPREKIVSPLGSFPDFRPLSISTARPSYVLAPPSTTSTASTSSATPLSTGRPLPPSLSNNLGSLPIRRDGSSTSSSTPYSPLPSISTFAPVLPQLSAPPNTLSAYRPRNSAASLLTHWEPDNDHFGPGSVRPKPFDPLPRLPAVPVDTARRPLERVVEESSESSLGTGPTPPLILVPTPGDVQAKSEPSWTPATTEGSLPIILPRPTSVVEQEVTLVATLYNSPGSTRPTTQIASGEVSEPSAEEQGRLEAWFVDVLGWLFPWYSGGTGGGGGCSLSGKWAVWSLGVRLSNSDDDERMARAKAYLDRAKQLAATLILSSQPNLQNLQSITLIAWADYGLTDSAKTTWTWCGVGLRLAEGLGVYDVDPAVALHLPPVLQSLYQLDKILSIQLHRTPSYPFSSPLAKYLPRPASNPSTAFEAVTTLCAFLGQIALVEHAVKEGFMVEDEARRRNDEVLQDLERWGSDMAAPRGFLSRREESQERGRVWVEVWLQGVLILLNSPRLILPQALPLDTNIEVAKSSALSVAEGIRRYSAFSPSLLLSPYLDLPIRFALSTLESDTTTSPPSAVHATEGGRINDYLARERAGGSRALKDWLKEAGEVWGF